MPNYICILLLDCKKRFSTTFESLSEFALALPFEFPHVPVIVEEKANLLRCMGSLITERVILSAADCVSSERYCHRNIWVNISVEIYPAFRITYQIRIFFYL